MKKNLFLIMVLAVIFSCNPKAKSDSGKDVVSDTTSTRVIDTTIIEDGLAPVADNINAKGQKTEKQKKEKISCGFGFKKFNTRKRPMEEAPGGVKGARVKPGQDTQPPTLNGDPSVSNVTSTTITLSWPAASDNKGVAGYDVYRNGVKVNTTNITSNGFADVGLNPSTTYSYFYKAKDGAGNVSVSSGSVNGTTTANNTGSVNVIYLNFFGKTVANTMWNVSGAFTVDSSGLSQSEIDYVLGQVREHYKDYDVDVTIDPAVYNAAQYGHKVEVIITESWEWYGQAGGVAYLNSFFWTDGTPAFVFSTLLNYNGHNIAEAAAHEAGHTVGLRHQSDCQNGVIVDQYNWGANGHAPTMGASYNVTLGEWYPDGPTPLGCDWRQNDPAILQSALGLKQIAYLRPRHLIFNPHGVNKWGVGVNVLSGM